MRKTVEVIPAAIEKAEAVANKLQAMTLPKVAVAVREDIRETLTYMAYPREHWRKMMTGIKVNMQ